MADLTPANQNPWYVLSTLRGEQTGDEIDERLAAENARLWNIWACQNLTEDERQALRDQGAEVPEAGAWQNCKADIESRFQDRLHGSHGSSITGMPSPSDKYNFDYINFSTAISFEKAVFLRPASFESTTFSKKTNFSKTFFNGAAYFRLAHFKKNVRFSKARFSKGAYFERSQFDSSATFSSSVFNGLAKLDAVHFLGFIYFSNSVFGSSDDPKVKKSLLSLSDTKFEKPASFNGAKFSNRFPEFRGTILPEQTVFPYEKDAEGKDPWPDGYPLFDEKWKPEEHEAKRTALMRDAANSCAVLRNHVKKQGYPEAEHYFFRREMEFIAEIGSPLQRFPYKAFGWVSDYGHSIGRPAGLLAVLWIVPALIYLMYFAWQSTMAGADFGPLEPFGFSFSNIFKFFGLQRTYFSGLVECLPRWLLTISALQTVFGYILLFFLGLGLRQRFRLR